METINFGEEQNNPAPKAPDNRKKKLTWAGIILAALILSVIGWQYWRYIHSPYYQQMKAVKTLEKLYADDTIGGKTPEETLTLYTEAIKKDDIDSALKYVGNTGREEAKKQLLEYKNLGRFQDYVDLLVKATKSNDESLNWNPDNVLFEVIDKSGNRILAMYIYKTKNGIWKIGEL